MTEPGDWDWPIDPDRVHYGARHDAEQAQKLADHCRLDAVGWSRVRWKTGELGKDQRFRRLAVRIADELAERREVLYATDLRKLMEDTK